MKRLITDSYYIAWRELKKYFREKTRLIMTIVQPFIWLVLMGNMMSGLTSNPYAAQMLGTANYLTFMTPGIILMTVLFSSIFSGMSIIWDRRIGYLDKLLAAPIRRGAIPFGKMFSAMIQGGIQVVVIIIIATFLGVKFKTGVAGILVILFIAMCFALILGGISLTIAVKIKTPETLMAIVNFFMMPLLFTSNALFPLGVMPAWLKAIAKVNPITYAVEPMRTLAVTGWSASIFTGISIILIIDVLVLLWTQWVFKRAVSE
ncbi:MAG: ABC transporter permease [Caldisericota bacterium]|nr:ABC transporter permease [Caldisericota bacterium]